MGFELRYSGSRNPLCYTSFHCGIYACVYIHTWFKNNSNMQKKGHSIFPWGSLCYWGFFFVCFKPSEKSFFLNSDNSPFWFLSIIFKAVLWQCSFLSSEASCGMLTIMDNSCVGNLGNPFWDSWQDTFMNRMLIAHKNKVHSVP